jgi:hypothetical protein
MAKAVALVGLRRRYEILEIQDEESRLYLVQYQVLVVQEQFYAAYLWYCHITPCTTLEYYGSNICNGSFSYKQVT